jgi:RNA polymerase sigma factor (sigma-70 family)
MLSDIEQLVLLAQENEELYLATTLKANMGMIVDRASSGTVSGLGYEEIMSEMKIGAIMAVRSFNPAKGHWPNHLHTILRNHMARLMRQRMNGDRWRMDKLEHLFERDEGDGYEQECEVFWPIEGLSVEDGAILELSYMHGLTLAEIGRIVGTYAQKVHWRLGRALKRARALLED